MFNFSKETKDDTWEVEYLYDLSFAPGREALSSYRLRADIPPVEDLCWIARDEYCSVAGAIRFWPVLVGEKEYSALLLGPIAVHPTHQGEGLGGLLMSKTLERATELGWERVILIGDSPYYERFGFRRSDTLEFPQPTNPDRLLSLGLTPNAFDGVFGKIRPAKKA